MKIENGVLIRHVNSNHLHFKTKSYMFDEEIMKKLDSWKELQIITKYGRVYSISRSDFDSKSTINKDYGKVQIAIKVEDLKIIKENVTVKMIAVFNNTHQKIKEEASKLGLTMADYLELKFA